MLMNPRAFSVGISCGVAPGCTLGFGLEIRLLERTMSHRHACVLILLECMRLRAPENYGAPCLQRLSPTSRNAFGHHSGLGWNVEVGEAPPALVSHVYVTCGRPDLSASA